MNRMKICIVVLAYKSSIVTYDFDLTSWMHHITMITQRITQEAHCLIEDWRISELHFRAIFSIHKETIYLAIYQYVYER